MQIKTTLRYLSSPTKVAVIKERKERKRKKKQCWKTVEKLEPLGIAGVKCKMVQPLWKRVWQFFKKLNRLPHASATPLLGMYPKELKTGTWTDTCTAADLTQYLCCSITAKRQKWSVYPSTDCGQKRGAVINLVKSSLIGWSDRNFLSGQVLRVVTPQAYDCTRKRLSLPCLLFLYFKAFTMPLFSVPLEGKSPSKEPVIC